jgi:D-serine deaminase-like pyridoxal phosphate-dependent protein
MNVTELSQFETPRVLLDHARLVRNIEWAQALAQRHQLTLRPHIKTHKSLEIAKMQLSHGASGITCAKPDEALVFIRNCVPSVTVAYPVIHPAKLERLLGAARENATDLRMVVDSDENVAALSDAAAKSGMVIPVYVEIDVGLHRCGVREDEPRLVPLVKSVVDSDVLRFVGILSHAGHAYGASGEEEARRIARQECEQMIRIQHLLSRHRIPVQEVSIGSTPTILANDSYAGITELRPGNYVFMDLLPLRLHLIKADQIALSILATVVSANTDFFIIDAGSKVLSSDSGAHGTISAAGYGVAFELMDYEAQQKPLSVTRLSEEHGFVRRDGRHLKVGSLLRILPNHACPVVNLAESYLVLKNGKPETWKVDARARVL